MKHTLLFGAILSIFPPLVFAIDLVPGDSYTGTDSVVNVTGGGVNVYIDNSNIGYLTANTAGLIINSSTIGTLDNSGSMYAPGNITTVHDTTIDTIINSGKMAIYDAYSALGTTQYTNTVSGTMAIYGNTNIAEFHNSGDADNYSGLVSNVYNHDNGFLLNYNTGIIQLLENEGTYNANGGYTVAAHGMNATNELYFSLGAIADYVYGDFGYVDVLSGGTIKQLDINTGAVNVNSNAIIESLNTLNLNSSTTNDTTLRVYGANSHINHIDVSNMKVDLFEGTLGLPGGTNYFKNQSNVNVLQTVPVQMDGTFVFDNSTLLAENPNAQYNIIMLQNNSKANILDGSFNVINNMNSTAVVRGAGNINTINAVDSTTRIFGANTQDVNIIRGDTLINGGLTMIDTLNITSDTTTAATVSFFDGEVQNVNALSNVEVNPTVRRTQMVFDGSIVRTFVAEYADVDYTSGYIDHLHLSKNAKLNLVNLWDPMELLSVNLLQSTINMGGTNSLITNTLGSTNGRIENINVNLNNFQSDALITVNGSFAGNITLALNPYGDGALENKVLLISLPNDIIEDENVSLSGNDIKMVSGMSIQGAYQISSSPYLWDTVREANGWYLAPLSLFTPTTVQSITIPAITALSTAQSLTQGLRQHLQSDWSAEMGQNVWGHMTWDSDTIKVTNSIETNNDMRGFDVGIDMVNTNHGGWGVAASYRGMHHTIKQSESGLINKVQNDATALIGTWYGRYIDGNWEQNAQIFGGQVWSNQNYDNGQDSYKGSLYGLDYEVGYRIHKGNFSYLPYVGIQKTKASIQEDYQLMRARMGVDINYQEEVYTWTLSPHINMNLSSQSRLTLSDYSTINYEVPKISYGMDIRVAKENKWDTWFVKIGSHDIRQKNWNLSLGGSVKF